MAAFFYSSLKPSTTPLHHLSFSPQPQAISTAATSPTQNLRLVFAAGGTGGHIYPAIAIADHLKTLHPNAQFLFVGTPTGMEATAVPSAGFPFTPAPAVPLRRPFLSLYNLFLLPFILANSILHNLRILQQFDPHIVIGTGGFVSFPTCLAAAVRGVKLIIQEQNSAPGIANLVLSLFAHKIFVAFDSSVDRFLWRDKCVVCGNPVRLSLMNGASKEAGRRRFFPGMEVEKVVVVLGGSLGAYAINVAMVNVYCQLLSENDGLFVIWQTGMDAFTEMESLVRTHPRLLLFPFLNDVDLAYAAADLVVSRAGAMTCSEILATGKPSILIPSPYAAEGHQLKNAQLMANVAGSRVITEDELDSATLRNAIQGIIDNDTLMEEMSERALKAAKTKASAEIAELIIFLTSEVT
ncbi:UDP-N-acetylglucosamine--N-acetylmuramyl-(pentapeptide) pyrophosphoryl-undecaprenol N-acetylglucosamine transferase [Salvia splendens]|uniref:UDP-N-acetylglucosamine--N-acetylmuramyl- (pentapeptide) pyrophosphoryl-undecaprenol N-acetylglucosamine transferase n=1 Tax=Salvia splendens TaxID=180675 RepID=UPI001C25A9DF|nr:UDP-N-acetylglucosamine--N-acetylmuramyl-(pentapeptide) pyrophosphoryl-undecaprenol N-acetylglucosamine transferase [Salvia splendens]